VTCGYKTNDTDTPAAAIANEFPLAIATGCPVHVPNRCRVVAFGAFQISSPTIDQGLPLPFVHA